MLNAADEAPALPTAAPLTGETYRALFAGADQGFCLLQVIFDAEDRPIDYLYLDINDAFERQSGLENAKGKTIREMVPDIDRQWFEMYGKVALTGQSVHYENYIPALSRWFGVFAYRIGPPEARQVGVLFNDNTARKRAEEALQAALTRNERIAETLQRSLLLAPAPDAYAGVTIEAVYHSAWDDAQIGGDFFDVFPVDAGRIALIVGDATGKGVEAATYTAEIKFALRAFLRVEDGAPALALNRLTDFIARNVILDTERDGRSPYVALSLVVLNTGTGELTCACAGAEPPIILRSVSGGAGEPVTTEVATFGPLLGVAPEVAYDAEHLRLAPGDLLLMTTDGLTEARPPRGALARPFFGLDGLARAARQGMEQSPTEPLATGDKPQNVNETIAIASPPVSLAQIGAFIVEENSAWAGGIQHDDICLLLVCRR